jgi:hypothetical protein
MKASIWLFMVVGLTASAAGAAGKGGRAPDKKTVVKFDGDNIDGDLMRPDGDLMSVRPELDMPSLVVPPASFERAARRTVLSAADAVSPHRAQNTTAGSH